MNIIKNRWTRRAAKLLVVLLWGFLMLRWFEHRCVFQPSAAIAAEAAQLGRPAEDVFIPVDKNGKIEAWFFPADSGSALSSRRVILICHGNAGNISHRLELCRLLLETGASFFSKLETSGYRLKPKTLKPKSRRFAVSLRTTKISAQIHRQKIGVCLMPNV